MGEIAVYDPKKTLGGMLKKLVANSTPIDDWKNPPAGTKLLIVGPDAVSAKDSADPAWVGLLAKGINVLVLDQANPLRYLAVPAPVEPTNLSGSIAFPENLTYPAFAGLATSRTSSPAPVTARCTAMPTASRNAERAACCSATANWAVVP